MLRWVSDRRGMSIDEYRVLSCDQVIDEDEGSTSRRL